eukprot:6206645-Pleurochrysis_carterae.AAC.1
MRRRWPRPRAATSASASAGSERCSLPGHSLSNNLDSRSFFPPGPIRAPSCSTASFHNPSVRATFLRLLPESTDFPRHSLPSCFQSIP